MSTSPYDMEITGPKNKPKMINDYNKLKGGVDNMGKNFSENITKRKTNRWPLAFFYNMLDVAAFAAFILYKENNPQYNTSTNKRRMFLQQLCEQLAMPEIEIQSDNIQILRHFGPRSGYERRSYKSTSY